jgi:preprotein translocase subunit SecA
MFKFLTNFSQNSVSPLTEQVQEINRLEDGIACLTENEIKEKINQLIKRYQIEQNFDSILCESFALTREASKRTLGLRHFDTQLMGGIELHNGKIAEMKTGEGKTLVATLPVVLNALSLKGVHVITVNDYLAKRDKQWMSQLYRYLGLSVGLIQENMDSNERRKNYSADITYVTNSEVAFDYLRDNMSNSSDELVLRDFNYCIVDEVDSILIDEARTPLIIAGSVESPIEKYVTADEVCNYLKAKSDYIVDEKNKNLTLTTKGIKKVEQILNVTTLYNVSDPWMPFINNALKAKNLFLKDVNYIVRNDEIVIVDEFTGRVLAERRWGDGLHQAVEAKERVPIKSSSETLASVTYQNFFLSYPKFGGMTGTAKTAEAELESIYNRQVSVIPTARKMVRKDLSDLTYKDEFTKWQAVSKESENIYRLGRPILIGTTSIEKSEIISELLKDRGIKHRLLNAKPENIQREAEIIAQAGRRYSVTVSTNMAGRGTDILLGGNPEFQTRQNVFTFIKNFTNTETNKIENEIILKEILLAYKLYSINYSEILNSSKKLKYYTTKQLETLILNLRENGYVNTKNPIDIYINSVFEYFYRKNKKNCNAEKTEVQNLGGLYVIGTERHESRRIDNQLRGRAGRQGDPGTSRFFISLDDSVFRIFGGDRIKNMVKQFNLDDDTPLESNFLNNALDKAQQKVEDFYYDSRKKIFDYDEVLNRQRVAIYRERKAILLSKSVRSEMIAYGESLICDIIEEAERLKFENENLKFDQLNTQISYLLSISYLFLDYKKLNKKEIDELQFKLTKQFWLTYDLKEAEFEASFPNLIRILEKTTLLEQIDFVWKSHLQKADILRETIGWRGYGQLDPLREYKNEAFKLFIETITEIKYNSVYEILKMQIS